MPTYNITHLTSFHYSCPVAVSHHSAHLKPRDNHEQKCHRFHIEIKPRSADMMERLDFFGNTTQLFSIQESHSELFVESQSVVTTTRQQTALSTLNSPCGQVKQNFKTLNASGLNDEVQFLYATQITPDLEEVYHFSQRFFADNRPIGECLHALLNCFKQEFEFDPTATNVHTPISESLQKRRGVCQDFAHLSLATLRAAGFSAQYCSGYILTHPTDGKPRLLGADASHAWVAVFIPGHGWLQIDPTNNAVCTNEYILVATGRDYSDVTMLKGAVTGGGEHQIRVGVTMLPVDEASPLITK